MSVDHEVQTPEGLQGRSGSAQAHVQLADTVIYAGTLGAMLSGKAQPAAGGTSGMVLLGIAEKTTTTPAGDDEIHLFDDPIVFKRGVFGLPGKPDDPPLESDVGSNVYIADNYSVKHTMATDDMPVKLVAIESVNLQNPADVAGAIYFVEIL